VAHRGEEEREKEKGRKAGWANRLGRPIAGKEKGGEEGKGDGLGQGWCWAWPTRESTQISYILVPRNAIYVYV
jgi:hypothetical protein